MPYIRKALREDLDGSITHLLKDIRYLKRWNQQAGILSYVISRLLFLSLPEEYLYSDLNQVIGILNSVEAEFTRRVIVPYEDEKKMESGDVFTRGDPDE